MLLKLYKLEKFLNLKYNKFKNHSANGDHLNARLVQYVL